MQGQEGCWGQVTRAAQKGSPCATGGQSVPQDEVDEIEVYGSEAQSGTQLATYSFEVRLCLEGAPPWLAHPPDRCCALRCVTASSTLGPVPTLPWASLPSCLKRYQVGKAGRGVVCGVRVSGLHGGHVLTSAPAVSEQPRAGPGDRDVLWLWQEWSSVRVAGVCGAGEGGASWGPGWTVTSHCPSRRASGPRW